MNGVSTGNYAYNGGLLSPTQTVGPGRKQIMEGYRKDVLSGIATNQRYNIVSCAAQLLATHSRNSLIQCLHSRPQKGLKPLPTST